MNRNMYVLNHLGKNRTDFQNLSGLEQVYPYFLRRYRNIFLLFLLIFVLVGCDEPKEVVDAQREVNAFLLEINPELYQSLSKMRQERTLADKKIPLLHDLKDKYPNQREMIDKSLKQWQELRKNLDFTLNDISHKVEVAYVAYKIDEIQGRQKFSETAKALLTEANTVLANAETTKSLIEEQLYDQ